MNLLLWNMHTLDILLVCEYFQKVMLLWQGSIMEIDYGFFRVFGSYFIGKSLGTFKILIFGFWSFISHPSIILQNNEFSLWWTKLNIKNMLHLILYCKIISYMFFQPQLSQTSHTLGQLKFFIKLVRQLPVLKCTMNSRKPKLQRNTFFYLVFFKCLLNFTTTAKITFVMLHFLSGVFLFFFIPK